jgi:hypothetical protein
MPTKTVTDFSTTVACPACRDLSRCHSEDLDADANKNLRHAIASGDDLGGVFELAASLAEARFAVSTGGGADSLKAAGYAATILNTQKRIAAAFAKLEPRRRPCSGCRLRDQLACLMYTAVEATADERAGVAASWQAKLIDACKELAYYAGDDHPNEESTLAALGRARDVFLAALAAESPEQLR